MTADGSWSMKNETEFRTLYNNSQRKKGNNHSLKNNLEDNSMKVVFQNSIEIVIQGPE